MQVDEQKMWQDKGVVVLQKVVCLWTTRKRSKSINTDVLASLTFAFLSHFWRAPHCKYKVYLPINKRSIFANSVAQLTSLIVYKSFASFTDMLGLRFADKQCEAGISKFNYKAGTLSQSCSGFSTTKEKVLSKQ